MADVEGPRMAKTKPKHPKLFDFYMQILGNLDLGSHWIGWVIALAIFIPLVIYELW